MYLLGPVAGMGEDARRDSHSAQSMASVLVAQVLLLFPNHFSYLLSQPT